MVDIVSKFRPPSYRSSRDPDSFGGCDVITPLSFIISIDNHGCVKIELNSRLVVSKTWFYLLHCKSWQIKFYFLNATENDAIMKSFLSLQQRYTMHHPTAAATKKLYERIKLVVFVSNE